MGRTVRMARLKGKMLRVSTGTMQRNARTSDAVKNLGFVTVVATTQ
jgi:hypothetical protein